MNNSKERLFYNSFLIILSISFFVFVEVYDVLSFNKELKKMEELSKTLSFMVWNLDRTTTRDYLDIVLQNNDYESINILLEDNKLFLEISDEHKINSFEKIFLKTNFIKIYNIQVPVIYNNQKIATLSANWINKNVYLYNYVILILLLLSAIIYYYIKVEIQRNDLAQANIRLELEIKEKKLALEEIQKLKLQQDGDYFLTSLLLIPLSYNYGNNEKVNVEFFVKQKKDFKFKSYEREIGGDICISHIITLKNKKYTVCVNADCMGKSIQGAGGCLVLGAVFEAIIERVKLSKNISEMTPERWLKYAFLELHKVFESFEGSMMASIFICLIDNDNGFMYYMNAEHPFPIIYKNLEAQYFDREFMLYKLGMDLKKNHFLQIRTFQLELNDVIIVGSDGKDDIVLRRDESGEDIVNVDDNFILEIIMDAKGDLKKMYELISKKGQIIDDISLLKITYKNDNFKYKINEIQKILKEVDSSLIYNKKEIEDLVNIEESFQVKIHDIYLLFKKSLIHLIKRKKFQECIILTNELLKIYPEKDDLLFIMAYCNYKIESYTLAIDYSESLRTRNLYHRKNLILLGYIYLKQNNFHRAKEIIDMYKDIYQVDKSIENIEKKIQNVS